MASLKQLAAAFGIIQGALLVCASPSVAGEMRTYTKRGLPYEDVKMDLESAIEGKGLRIGAVGDLGNMLDRTRADLKAGPQVYKSAHYLQFCSALYAHKLTAADPQSVGYCPFLMFIYEPVANPGDVVIGYRAFARTGTAATQALLDEVDALLDSIAREAMR